MRKKIDHNNLLPYFTDNHEDLPQDYLEECKEFFKSLTKEQDEKENMETHSKELDGKIRV
jgi:hypothetical protein